MELEICNGTKAMISDPATNFPLRGANDTELGIALAQCMQDFHWWHGQAVTIARFPIDARAAGIESILAERNQQFLDLAELDGWLKPAPSATKLPNSVYAQRMVPQQLDGIDHSARVAAIVMLHSACDRFYWRLVRFAMVPQRSKAVQRLADRKITVQELVTTDRENLIDDQLEKWWSTLERESLLGKWDALISIIGSPSRLRDVKWHFDREMLVVFDTIRHHCVHQSGSMLKQFDFEEFASQLVRAQLVWSVTIAQTLNVKVPAEIAFGSAK